MKFYLILRSHCRSSMIYTKVLEELAAPVCRVKENFYTLKAEALHSSKTWYIYTKLHIITSQKIVTFQLGSD